jgi:protein SCO1
MARNNRSTLLVALLLAQPLAGKIYPVDGIVVAVDASACTMLVSHRPIERYMAAMTMPFRVESAAALRALHPGSRIRFDLAVDKSESVARNVRTTGEEDAALPAPKEQLAIGASLPDFSLTDQYGKPVRLADLLGKVVAIDFIYTRCPLPDVCPRLSANFATLQRRFAGQLGRDLLLISVTVDPDYDSPSVLADYARRWSAQPTWRFLTGGVAQLASALGEIYWVDEGSIGHNSTTSIIDREGRLAAVLEGSNYRADQLMSLIAYQLEKQQ